MRFSNTWFDELSKLKLLMISGKGGIGKTLASAALASALAKRNKRVLLISASAHDKVGSLFGVEPLKHRETRLRDNLFGINLNSADNFREYITKYLGLAEIFETVFTNKMVQSLVQTIPGISELMLLGRLYYTCELMPEPRYDMVIFDGFAFGHFYSLMTTPDAVEQAGLVGPILRDTKKVKAFLRDPEKCGTLLVAVPEELIVGETLEFLPKLNNLEHVNMRGVIVNRYVNPDDIKKASEWCNTNGKPKMNDYLAYLFMRQKGTLAPLGQLLDVEEFAQLHQIKMIDVGFFEGMMGAEVAAKLFENQTL